MDATGRRTILHDSNAFFLLRNLLTNRSGDNLVIIYHALTGGDDVKGWSISRLSLVLVQTTCSRLGRSSWATEGRSIPVVFLCQHPRVAVRNGIPNYWYVRPRHGVACTAPSSRRCPSAMTYSTSVHSAVTFTSLIICQAVQTLSRPPRRIQRRHRHWRFHGQHGYPRASP